MRDLSCIKENNQDLSGECTDSYRKQLGRPLGRRVETPSRLLAGLGEVNLTIPIFPPRDGRCIYERLPPKMIYFYRYIQCSASDACLQFYGAETYLDKTHAHPADQRLQCKPECHLLTHARVSNPWPMGCMRPKMTMNATQHCVPQTPEGWTPLNHLGKIVLMVQFRKTPLHEAGGSK